MSVAIPTNEVVMPNTYQGLVFLAPIKSDVASRLAFALLPQKAYDQAYRAIEDGWPTPHVVVLGESWELWIDQSHVWFSFVPPSGVMNAGAQIIASDTIERAGGTLGNAVKTFTLPWPHDKVAIRGVRTPHGFRRRYLQRSGRR